MQEGKVNHSRWSKENRNKVETATYQEDDIQVSLSKAHRRIDYHMVNVLHWKMRLPFYPLRSL